MTDCVRRPEESREYYFREGCHILEILNDEAHPDLSVARARVKPGVTTRSHFLRGTTEHYLITQGQGEVMVGVQPDAQAVGPGDVVVIPPGVNQCIRNIGSDDLVFHALCTPRFRVENYCESGG